MQSEDDDGLSHTLRDSSFSIQVAVHHIGLRTWCDDTRERSLTKLATQQKESWYDSGTLDCRKRAEAMSDA